MLKRILAAQDLHRAYSRLMLMAVFVVLTLFIAQFCWVYKLDQTYATAARVLLVATLVVHFEFFVYSFRAFLFADDRIPADVYTALAIAGFCDLLCVGVDLLGLGGGAHPALLWFGMVPFILLVVEMGTIIHKLERRLGGQFA